MFRLARGGRERCFLHQDDWSYCAAQTQRCYGFKLGLRVSRCGLSTHYRLLAARPHDIKHLPALVEAFHGHAPADKGFLDPV